MADSNKLDLILLKLETFDEKFDSLESRLDNLEGRFDNLESRFDNLESRFDNLEGRFDNLEGRFDNLEGRFDNLEGRFDNLEGQFDDLKKQFHNLEGKVSALGLHIENYTDKNIQLLAENFIELTNKLNQAIPVAEKNLTYEIKVNYLMEEMVQVKRDIAELKQNPVTLTA